MADHDYAFRCYELFQVAWRSHSPDEAKSKFSERPRFLEELNVIKLYSIPYLINQDPHWVLKLISAN